MSSIVRREQRTWKKSSFARTMRKASIIVQSRGLSRLKVQKDHRLLPALRKSTRSRTRPGTSSDVELSREGRSNSRTSLLCLNMVKNPSHLEKVSPTSSPKFHRNFSVDKILLPSTKPLVAGKALETLQGELTLKKGSRIRESHSSPKRRLVP